MARVLVPLAQGCEELEAVTVIDLLRRAGAEVTTAGLTAEPIKASRGVVLLADVELEHVLGEQFDMVVLPGGLPGADNLAADSRVRSLLRRMSASGQITAAICAAPKVLAAAGLLEGRRATAYPGILEALSQPTINIDGGAVVRDGNVVTSRGPGTAMDFALELIALLLGEGKRAEVERGLARG